MNTQRKSTAFIFAFTFVVAVTFVYLLIATALVPYWQGFSGIEIQEWWAGPFVRFSYLMVPLHVLSIISIITAFVMHRKEPQPLKTLWIVAAVTALICQGFNFGVHGADYNMALQSGTLDPQVALEIFDKWDVYHTVRTISVSICMLCLIAIGIRSNKTA